MLRRGDLGYEAARKNAVSNGRKPERFPEVIVQAQNDGDIIAAISYAREHDLTIGVRSGGHSWAASFLRDGGMLIDLSRMNNFTIDPSAKVGSVQPGVRGLDLNRALQKHDLFFPSGHCRPVSLGGFLLQGGFGWNSRVWGPACMSVRAIDVVTADGEMRRADASENSDLYWAARGAGPGFFGVVTKFYLDLYLRPKTFMRSDYVYPMEVYDELLRFVRDVQPRIPRSMECMVFTRRDLPGLEGRPGALLTGPVLTETRDQAVSDLAILQECPVLDKAVMRYVNIDTELEQLLQDGEDLLYPVGARYASDNMWTNASADELLPGMRKIVETMPAAPSHMMWMLWGPSPERPDMAYSVEDDLYIALYGVWHDPDEDARHQAWVTDNMKQLERHSSGIQLADENLGARPFRFMTAENMKRLEAIPARYDPGGLFHSYMGLAA